MLGLDVTNRGVETRRWPVVLGRTLPGLELVDLADGRRLAHPLQHLPVCYKEHVGQRVHRAEEPQEAPPVVDSVEPGRVIEETKGGPVGLVVAVEVFHEHLVDSVLVGRIRAGVAHRAAAPTKVHPHGHTDLPNTWEALGGTRGDHALMCHLIVECVGPQRGRILEDGHRRIIGKVCIIQHLEHFVASNLQKWRSHSTDVVHLDPAVHVQDLTLAIDLLEPLIL